MSIIRLIPEGGNPLNFTILLSCWTPSWCSADFDCIARVFASLNERRKKKRTRDREHYDLIPGVLRVNPVLIKEVRLFIT